MYNLFYLVEQDGDINGAKYLVGSFDSLEEAKAQAAFEHYSVEYSEDATSCFICFIV